MKYFFLIGAAAACPAAKKNGNPLSILENALDATGRCAETDHEIYPCGFLGEEEEIVRYLVNTHTRRPLRIVVCGTLENLHFAVNGQVGVPGVEIGFLSCDPGLRCDGESTDAFCTSPNTVASLFPGRVIDVDLIQVNERYCVSGAAFGFDAGLRAFRRRVQQWAARFLKLRLPEALTGRLFRLVSMVFHTSAKTVRICINGHEIIEDQMMYLLFANMRQCAEGYPSIAQAIIDDGLADVLSVEKPPLTILPTLISSDPCADVLQNEFLRDFIRYRRCITAEVELAEPTMIAMDGTLYLRDSRFLIETRPAALKMLAPNNRE